MIFHVPYHTLYFRRSLYHSTPTIPPFAMPELPEVEVTRLSFADRIQGACITALRLGLALRWPLGIEPEQLVGRTIGQTDRRGKYIIMHLDRGLLLWHLGMSGAISFANNHPPPGRTTMSICTPVVATCGCATRVVLVPSCMCPDLQHRQALKLLGRLGVEPLGPEFLAETFHRALKRRKAPIKQVLAGGRYCGRCRQYLCQRSAIPSRHPAHHFGGASQSCQSGKTAPGHRRGIDPCPSGGGQHPA